MGKYTKPFSVNVTGDKTYEQFFGEFEVKTMLSHEDNLQQDRMRREFLAGPDGVKSSANAEAIAEVFSQLRVRVLRSPTWWGESNHGINLYDNNVVREVYEKATAAEAEEIAAIAKRAESARAGLATQKPIDQ